MKPKTSSQGIYEILRPFRRVIATIALFLFAGQLLQLTSPYILGRVIHAYLVKASIWSVFQLALLGLGAFLAKNYINYRRERYELKRFENAIPLHLSDVTMDKLFGWSIAQHRRNHSGMVQSIVVEGEQNLINAAHLITYEVFEVITQMTLTIGLIFWLSPFIGFVVLAVGIIFSVTTYSLNMHIREDLLEYERRKHEVNKSYIEVQRNAPLVLVQAQEEREKAKCLTTHTDLRTFGTKTWNWYCKWAGIRNVQIGVGECIVIALGGYLVFKKNYAPGAMVTLLFWSRDLFAKLHSIGPIIRKSYRLWPGVVAYLELLDTQPEIVPDPHPVHQPIIHGKIEARDVTFWHDREGNAIPSLIDINFSIEPGEKIGIVGSSGAGKSTLINLLLRANDPNEGSIRIDDIDLRFLDVKQYRRSVGFVEQHVPILDRTLRENILFGLDDPGIVTEAKLEEIARLCRIDEFLDGLPNGFDTMLGDQGLRLSGGQCQRVGIARALVKNPSILIFDEATSHLDSENEFLVHQAIDSVSKGRTTIIIAHRMSTVMNCDRILVVENGRLIGQDVHAILMDSCAAYATLVHRQLIN